MDSVNENTTYFVNFMSSKMSRDIFLSFMRRVVMCGKIRWAKLNIFYRETLWRMLCENQSEIMASAGTLDVVGVFNYCFLSKF